MPESGVDDGIRRCCSATQAFQLLQIASMRLGAGGFKRLCARIRSRQPKNVMACADEFFHYGGTDESGSAGNEYAHMSLSYLIPAKIDQRMPPQLKRRHPPDQ
jgi:hypothetical protein